MYLYIGLIYHNTAIIWLQWFAIHYNIPRNIVNKYPFLYVTVVLKQQQQQQQPIVWYVGLNGFCVQSHVVHSLFKSLYWYFFEQWNGFAGTPEKKNPTKI